MFSAVLRNFSISLFNTVTLIIYRFPTVMQSNCHRIQKCLRFLLQSELIYVSSIIKVTVFQYGHCILGAKRRKFLHKQLQHYFESRRIKIMCVSVRMYSICYCKNTPLYLYRKTEKVKTSSQYLSTVVITLQSIYSQTDSKIRAFVIVLQT